MKKSKTNLIIVNDQIVMSSREIAKLCNKRHDNVANIIKEMINGGVLKFSRPHSYINEQNNQEYIEYLCDKRDSIVVVARLSPEFTALIVDRWQELENQKLDDDHCITYKFLQEINKKKGATKQYHFINLGKATKGRNKKESFAIRGATCIEAIKHYEEIADFKELRLLGVAIKNNNLLTRA